MQAPNLVVSMNPWTDMLSLDKKYTENSDNDRCGDLKITWLSIMKMSATPATSKVGLIDRWSLTNKFSGRHQNYELGTPHAPSGKATMFPRSPAWRSSSKGDPWSFFNGLKWGPEFWMGITWETWTQLLPDKAYVIKSNTCLTLGNLAMNPLAALKKKKSCNWNCELIANLSRIKHWLHPIPLPLTMAVERAVAGSWSISFSRFVKSCAK